MEIRMETFKNQEFGQVRIIQESNHYLFCGSDVAGALGYSNARDALRRHCKGVVKRDTLTGGGTQSLLFIPEGDVYRLIVHSKLPTAERFEHWVFDEVLPCIRQHGAYATTSVLEQFLSQPKLVYQMASTMLEERRKRETLQAELAVIKPKADYYDAFVSPDDCTNIRTTAKEVNVPERKFTAYLHDHGYLYRAPTGILLPYAKQRNKGLFIVRDFYCRAGMGFYTLITPKGKDYFRRLAPKIRGEV